MQDDLDALHVGHRVVLGYGFTVRRSHNLKSTTAEHLARSRGFLAEVDPITGYIEDDPGEPDAGTP